MITVSDIEYKALKEAGLIREKMHLQDPNFYNTKHRHFVSEEPTRLKSIMTFSSNKA